MRVKKYVAALSAVAVVAAAAASTAGAFTWGGSGGVVSLHRVGSLRMNVSGAKAIRRYAGAPANVEYQNNQGVPASRSRATYMGVFYGHTTSDGDWKGTQYWLHRSSGRWRLEQFSTTSKRWRTPAGTRVGMTYTQAKNRERVKWSGGCIATGFWHSTSAAPYYEYVADTIGPGHRIAALVATGPRPPLC